MEYYLAIDIGASSGRHILGHYKDGNIHLEEIYRFENGVEKRNNHLCWDLNKLYKEIINGLKKCKEIGKVPKYMGIDTWGVDFVLLDKEDVILGDSVSYRDSRTAGMNQFVQEKISNTDLYKRTGIQMQPFNTIYQLMAIKKNNATILEKAESFLMIPDYLNFLLTGYKCNEYTNATTTQLVSIETKQWDYELLDRLGFKKNIFKDLSKPGSIVGDLKPELESLIGFNLKVVLPATHDTGSAVMSIPVTHSDFLYISSGTWSLMGIESITPIHTVESFYKNFTNEGGYGYRYRFLKNIMGLWMIQNVRHDLNDTYSFSELCDLAKDADDFPSRIDVNDPCFLAPENMTKEIKRYLVRTNQKIPETVGELAACIYQSLAKCYADIAREIEYLTGKKYSVIYIVGGGSNANYLNELTAKTTGKKVYAGPSEATAIGNIAAQMLQSQVFSSIDEARVCINQSFHITEYNF
ncbi:MAG: rhamnulokinase [Anaerocolumna sp.]|jgi:rhamnulokinase|nr:rhamnulokinase [Anaerocolumna sp.]